MSKRSNWAEFDKETRKIIKKRDKNRCVACGNTSGLQVAHIFLSRAKGGRGSEKNGLLLCTRCHNVLDNPIGQKNNEISKNIKVNCEKYLIEKYMILDKQEFIKKELVYNKEYVKIDVEKISIEIQKKQKKCRNCIYLVKNNPIYSTLPTYYCKYRKININKNTPICKSFKEKENEL